MSFLEIASLSDGQPGLHSGKASFMRFACEAIFVQKGGTDFGIPFGQKIMSKYCVYVLPCIPRLPLNLIPFKGFHFPVIDLWASAEFIEFALGSGGSCEACSGGRVGAL